MADARSRSTSRGCGGKPVISDELKRRRKRAGLTQTELADVVGTSQGRIGEYERGEREPTLATLAAIAEVLGPFHVTGGVRTVEHYRQLLRSVETVGAQLFARALYAARHGNADPPDVDGLATITREVLSRHGEIVDAATALAELDD